MKNMFFFFFLSIYVSAHQTMSSVQIFDEDEESSFVDNLTAPLSSVWSSHMSRLEREVIVNVIRQSAGCKLLVFGVGKDALFWSQVNKGGVTVFLESDPFWIDYARGLERGLSVYLVTYNTRQQEWQELLREPDRLEMRLPCELLDIDWNVIIIDGPSCVCDLSMGRMKSIYNAAKIAKNTLGHSVDVFVHDADREVAKIYCAEFLDEQNLISYTGVLKHYRITKN